MGLWSQVDQAPLTVWAVPQPLCSLPAAPTCSSKKCKALLKKCLLCKYEGLSQDTQHPQKSQMLPEV